jgi:hypothetical protein
MFRQSVILVPAESNDHPPVSQGAAVALHWHVAQGRGLKPRYTASETVVLSLDDPCILAPLGGYDPPTFGFEDRRSFHLS